MVKNRLLNIRLELGYKFQKDFAEFLGMSKKDYNLIENNKKGISLEKALEIASRLNLKVEDIWFRE
ncbi:MAG: helix-turn-helix domain-containing protein [Clostridium celatum]|nr:helix-turn-helix domain-containing protein [Clostridium celatum]